MKFLNQFIKRGDALGRLQVAAKQFDALARRIRQTLDDNSAPHVRGCIVRADSLVVFTDGALWASMLRYRQNELLAVAREFTGLNLQGVRFKVLPSEPAARPPSAHDISSGSRQLLRQAADGVSDDELAEALRRLAGESRQDAD